MGRLRAIIAFSFAAAASVCAPGPVAADPCGPPFDGVASRLRDIETEQPLSAADLVRRSNELVALLADPSADLWQSVPQTCGGDPAVAQLQTIARRRILVLWGKMIELGAVDAPIFPRPYRAQCSRVDGAALQLDFIRAWVERLDDGGAGFSRAAVRRALDDDPLYAHVQDLALKRAVRLRVSALPSAYTDDAAWFSANQKLEARFAAALPAGTHCGTLALWGFERS